VAVLGEFSFEIRYIPVRRRENLVAEQESDAVHRKILAAAEIDSASAQGRSRSGNQGSTSPEKAQLICLCTRHTSIGTTDSIAVHSGRDAAHLQCRLESHNLETEKEIDLEAGEIVEILNPVA
jgi:hypothetical protein